MSERDADKPQINLMSTLRKEDGKKFKKFLQLIKLDAIISDTEKRKFPVAP